MKREMNSYYTREELNAKGFALLGESVFISKNTYIENPNKISVGDNTRIDDYTILKGEINIGSHVHIAAWNYLDAGRNKIIIKDFSTISGKGSVYATLEGVETYYRNIKKCDKNKDVYIGEEVVFGMSSIVLPGSVIADGNAFGAMSIIAGGYEEWGINVNYNINKIASRIKDRKRDLLLKEKEFLDEYNEKIK